MTPKEAYRDMLTMAGEHQSFLVFERTYRAIRGVVINSDMPCPQKVHDDHWSSRKAIVALKATDRMWKMGRDIDMELIKKRDG